jgi:hypothetical protein
VSNLRDDLVKMVDVAIWDWLSPHAARARVIVVGTMLDIVDVGVALTEDNTQVVQSWIADSWIRHPTAEEISDWNANKEKEFISLVIPPFVLIRLS